MDSNKVLIEFQETTIEPCKQKEVGINDAVEIAGKQTANCAPSRLLNPLWRLVFKLTGKSVAFDKAQRRADQNCLRLRTAIADYVQKRKSGQISSDFTDGSDLVSQMLAAPEMFSDDDIIDEVVDFLAAGTQTTQRATQAVLYRLMTQPEILRRVRNEYEELVGLKAN